MSWRGDALALGLGLLAAAYAWTATGSETRSETATATEPRHRDRAPRPSPATATEPRDRAPPPRPSPSNLPISLANTQPDGALHMNAYGDFIPTPGALRLFDYYLTTLGEIDLPTIRALIAADARRYAPDQTDAVLALFDRYTTYREDLQSALTIRDDLSLPDLHAVTLTRQRAHFGDDADLLFAEENALAAQLLASVSSSRKSRSLP